MPAVAVGDKWVLAGDQVNQFLEWIRAIFSSWKFWIVVPPWDIGVRVRLGQVAASLSPGVHWRIPMFDEIVLVNTRLRLGSTPTVTIAGRTSNRARVITAQVGYAIIEPVKALLRYTDPGSAIMALAQSSLSAGRTADECRAALNLEFGPHGIDVLNVYYTEDVEVRTYRLLQGGGGGVYSGSSMNFSAPGQASTSY